MVFLRSRWALSSYRSLGTRVPSVCTCVARLTGRCDSIYSIHHVCTAFVYEEENDTLAYCIYIT